MNKDVIIRQLRDEASRLSDAANMLETDPQNTNPPQAIKPTNAAFPINGEKKRTGRRRMSKETRNKLSIAQRERWAKQKGNPQAA